jgi:hemerythrin superfamily protein
MNVITLLKKDHKMVKNLFERFSNLKSGKVQKKADLIAQIKEALTVHAQVEEELVYPAFGENRSMKEQVSEALEEHHVTKMLLGELDALQVDGERYDAKVKVLCEYLMHHVKEEEKEIFPKAQKRLSSKRLVALGEEVEARHNELLGGDEDGETQERANMKKQEVEGLQKMEEEGGLIIEKEKRQRSRRKAA